MEIFTHLYQSQAIGELLINFNNTAITNIKFANQIPNTLKIKEKTNDIINECIRQFDLYFSGKLFEFDLPLDLLGTPWNTSVWNALRTVPFGEIRTYKDIAKQLGNEKAARAVGNANNNNPLPIIIPCHRIIGSNNKLIGFAGEIWRKDYLLTHERMIINKN